MDCLAITYMSILIHDENGVATLCGYNSTTCYNWYIVNLMVTDTLDVNMAICHGNDLNIGTSNAAVGSPIDEGSP